MNEIAKLVSTLGFDVDFSELERYEKRMQQTQKKIHDVGTRFTKQTTLRTKKLNGALASLEKRYFKHGGSLQKMRNDYYRINEQFKSGNIAIEKRDRLLRGIAEQYRNIKTEADRANRATEELNRTRRERITQFGDNLNQRVNTAGNAMVAAGSRMNGPLLAVAGAGVATYLAAGTAVRSNKEFQHFNSMVVALTAITGSVEKANEKILQLSKISDFYGTNLKASLEQYRSFAASLKGTKLEGQATTIFEAFTVYGTSLSISAEEQIRAMRALAQMASKGRISSEELTGQLAEALPGAVELFKEAGNFKDQQALRKAMENGEVLAKDILPEVARLMRERAYQGNALDTSRSNTSAVRNRLDNMQYVGNIVTNVSGLDKAIKDTFQAFTDGLKDSEQTLKAIGVIAENISSNLTPVIDDLANSVNDLSRYYLGNQKVIDSYVSGAFSLIDAPREALATLFTGIADTISNIIDLWGTEDTNFFIKVIKSLDELTRPIVELFSLISGKAVSLVELLTGFDIPNPFENIGTVGEGLNKVMEEAAEVFNRSVKSPLLNQQGGTTPNTLPFGQVIINPEAFKRSLERIPKSLVHPNYAGLQESIRNMNTVPSYLAAPSTTNNSSQIVNHNTTQDFTFNIESSDPVEVGNEVERVLNSHYRTTAGSYQVTEK